VPDQLPSSASANNPTANTARFSQLLNSAVARDHFDQYADDRKDGSAPLQPNGIPRVQRSLRYKDSTTPSSYAPLHPIPAPNDASTSSLLACKGDA
jgi:hypothetical protein